jgi:non-ribosomal peptide synthetase component F/thioesterase domain-containing protein
MFGPTLTGAVQNVNPEDPTVLDTTAPVDSSIDGVYVFPAGLEQTRYWVLDQLAGASTASNMAVAFHLEGPVQDDAAKQAVRALVLRHEALRTSFRMVDGALSQVISEEATYEFSVSDLRTLPEADRRDRAEELIHEYSRIHIDLANGPALYVRLIHVTDLDHFLAFTVHHIACDGWSNGVLIRDFALFYAAAVESREPSLPELPFQFADFTVWQHSWLESDAAQTALAFWKEHIRREMPAIDLPTDHPRTAQKSAPGKIEGRLLSPGLTARLKAYCRRHDATMHQVLLAAFEALIARYTGQTEFLLGSTIANRTQAGMENVVGRFAHPQVILADVRGNPSYRELLNRVVEWSAKSYAHQDLPFSRLAEQFQLDQAGATSQFLQVYFVYQKAFMQPQTAGEMRIIPRPSVSGGVNFDMLVSIVERNEGPRLQIEYNTLLFERERVLSMLDQYTRVLEAVMDDDTLLVSTLPLVSDEEQSALMAAATPSLPEATTAAADHPGFSSIAQLFDFHAAALGNSPALIAGDSRTSWKDLRDRCTRLANAMQYRGLRAGQTVVVRIEPSADSAAAVLAAMRRGLAILPVPASVSAAEWRKIQEGLKPALCLADARFAAKASAITTFAQLESGSRDASAEIFGVPDVAGSDTAWIGAVIRDDGSYEWTPVTHAAMLRSMTRAAQALGIKAGDAVFASASSDTAPLGQVDVWTDLLLPMLSGATLVYSDTEKPEQFRSVIEREQASFAFGTPAEWSRMLEGWAGDRRVSLVCRGSRLSPAVAERLAKSSFRVWSLISSGQTAGPFAMARVGSAHGDPLLAPLPGDTLRIVDGSGAPVPFGVPGELVVERDHLQLKPGYTARYSPAKGFELAGRLDRSVSLHGHRLRLEELEDLLLADPTVAAADAAIVPDTPGKPVLAAWVAGRNGQPPPLAALRAHLKSSAPPHLASAEIMAVAAIPRRIDGSADHIALPVPGSVPLEAGADSDYVPPRDDLEKNLVSIWESVLGVRPIGIGTNFFTLGGYSLMIVRLFANINRSLSLSLPITTIFNAPTIEQLADVVRGRTLYSPLVPVQPKGSKPPFFLVHSYLLYGGLPKVLGEDQPFYGLRELNQSMSMLERVASYAKEIRAVQPKGPYFVGGWCAAGPLAVETARLLIDAGEEVGMIVLFDSWLPGYAAELAQTQKHMPEMALRARLYRKWRFHRGKLQPLSPGGKLKYAWNAVKQKALSMRSRLYLKNWAIAQRLFQRLGLPLPAFMHNVSLQTFASIRSYNGTPLPGRITLVRATDAPYIPGAEPDCGWGALAVNGVDVHWAPGNHETMFIEPNLSVVGDIVRESLRKAQETRV